MTPAGSSAQPPSAATAPPAGRRRYTIDVGAQVTELEGVLRGGSDLARRMEALAILERWQFDETLDEASRDRAARLVYEFAARGFDDGGGAR